MSGYRWRCSVCGGTSEGGFPPGSVYIARRQDWIKVGMTTQPIEARLRQMRSTRPTVLAPLAMDWSAPLTLVVSSPVNVEHELHEQLADQHDRGEWFLGTTDNEAIRLMDDLVSVVEHHWAGVA